MKMKTSAVIFDLDGTLLDTLDDLTDALNSALLKMGREKMRTRDEVRSFVGNGARMLASRALSSEDPDLIDRCYSLFQEFYRARLICKTAPYPGIMQALCALCAKGVKLGVLSNKPDPATRSLCAHFFGPLLTCCSGEIPGVPRKPAPDGVLRLVSSMNVSPDETIYVGDSDVDIKTALSCGIVSVGVSWGFRPRETLVSAMAHHVIDHPYQLLDIVK